MTRTWIITIVHEGVNPNTEEVESIRSREKVKADSDSEAIVIAIVRTTVDRASMGTRITSIEVG